MLSFVLHYYSKVFSITTIIFLLVQRHFLSSQKNSRYRYHSPNNMFQTCLKIYKIHRIHFHSKNYFRNAWYWTIYYLSQGGHQKHTLFHYATPKNGFYVHPPKFQTLTDQVHCDRSSHYTHPFLVFYLYESQEFHYPDQSSLRFHN